MPNNAIPLKDALRLLEDHRPHTLRLWKISTGDVLVYKDAVCKGGWKRHGTHTVQLPQSTLFRTFRDVTLFNIDGMEIYW